MIVVAGESLIDLVPDGTGPLCALVPRRGGGPYNTAVDLGRLGADAAFCSRVCVDEFGEALLDGLRAAGVATGLVQRGTEPTTPAVAPVAADGAAGYGRRPGDATDEPGGVTGGTRGADGDPATRPSARGRDRRSGGCGRRTERCGPWVQGRDRRSPGADDGTGGRTAPPRGVNPGRPRPGA
ncbi:hypothetical protein GCM10010393_48630 [Streptomyces gobitricini]|uniref:Carbohydrate kinase PfkB domain-containing protein n=1 Tax=Streptomyces gobitricini TaxID=68211 RepID=A0ABN3MWV3_9ACTN